MCTSGVVSTFGRTQVQSLGFKTLDGRPISVWHGVVHKVGNLRALALGLTGVPGVNSGINEAGVGVILSYLDTCMPAETSNDDASRWSDDFRFMANAEALAKCESAVDMVDFYTRYFETRKSRGGNHLVFDDTGILFGLEHQAGDVRVVNYTNQGLTARGNDNQILPDEVFAHLPEPVLTDRRLRREVAASAAEEARHFLLQGDNDGAEGALKRALSQHEDGGTGIGSVCGHGVNVPGARSPSADPYITASGVIFDARLKTMLFSDGNPCTGKWRRLSL